MGKYLWRGLLTFLASNHAAAGLFSHSVSAQDLDGIQRMAVHVRMGDTFHARFIGTTVFNNKGFDAPVPQWAMDRYVADQVAEIMKLRGRFAAESLSVADLDLPSLYQKSGAILASKEVVATLLDRGRQQGADALLVVEMAPPSENAPFYPAGFGLMRRSAFGLTTGCAYAQFTVALFRVDSGKQIARQWAAPCANSPEKFPQKASWDQYSAEEQAALEAADKHEIIGKLTLAMQDFKFMKDMPP